MSRARDFADLAGSAEAGGITGKNLIINGAMQVWQRGTTIDTITSGDYFCDRWRIAHSGTDGNIDVDRSTDVPSGQGFSYSQKISMDASEASLDAADQINIAQRFEGQDLQKLAKGTSSAKSLTLSFWVKSSVASTYSINLYDNDNTRVISASYTVSATNTWEKKTITFAGDTTGALDNDNARSLDLTFWLDAGTDWTGGTFGTSWAANVNNTRAYDTTGWLESTSPEFYITGVQLEVGETATPFEHRSYGDELQRCMRYFERIGGYDYAFIANGRQRNTTQSNIGVVFKATKRANPTESLSNIIVTDRNTFNASVTSDSEYKPSLYGAAIRYDHSSYGSGNNPILVVSNSAATGYIDFDSEL
jgi:hypothetical protein